ncbi:YbaB/EbfC family nucleoid-associated protein [Actinomadura atramentaria]|uniref:YbaB/EbfC family nucleoid-associated protein n=1 Tax=Actinomadura atramentaria TaxID=1990 RepID=UPI0003A35647|nr:YbaB/EbfC family nucleoid-associated protein [Actinomadura atramentaria]
MLESMRAGRPGPAAGTPDAPDVEGTGEAADGRVKVTAVAGGRLKSVELDPRAMRMASQELGEALVTAANAALDDLRSRAAGAAADEIVDTAALGARVEEIQNESLRQMREITAALSDAVNKFGRA